VRAYAPYAAAADKVKSLEEALEEAQAEIKKTRQQTRRRAQTRQASAAVTALKAELKAARKAAKNAKTFAFKKVPRVRRMLDQIANKYDGILLPGRKQRKGGLCKTLR